MRDYDEHRRRLITHGLHLAGTSVLAATVSPWTAEAQPGRPDQERFMKEAFRMRQQALDRGDQAFGAVIVKAGQVVGEGPSRVIVNGDPTAHAEMEAVRDACRRLGTRNLNGCEMYASSRPCRMCEAACYWAQISRIYYGADSFDSGAPRYPSC